MNPLLLRLWAAFSGGPLLLECQILSPYGGLDGRTRTPALAAYTLMGF